MTIIGAAEGALLAGSVVSALVFAWCYIAGNAWWTSRVGRALVGLSMALVLVLGYGALKRLLGWPTVAGIQISLYGVVFLVTLGLAVAFLRERRDQRRRRQGRQQQHR